jgi:prepilin peptidase CpaA
MNSFLLFFAVLTVTVAALYDIRSRKIPNFITYPSMAISLVYCSLVDGMQGFAFSAGGLILGVTFFLIPYILGGMGAGDAKLMGALGATLGPGGLVNAALIIALAGGVYAVVLLIINRPYCKEFIKRNFLVLRTFAVTRQINPVPVIGQDRPVLCYGLAIALGTILYVSLSLGGYNRWIV